MKPRSRTPWPSSCGSMRRRSQLPARVARASSVDPAAAVSAVVHKHGGSSRRCSRVQRGAVPHRHAPAHTPRTGAVSEDEIESRQPSPLVSSRSCTELAPRASACREVSPSGGEVPSPSPPTGHAFCSHRVPLNPDSHAHTPFRHVPCGPQSCGHVLRVQLRPVKPGRQRQAPSWQNWRSTQPPGHARSEQSAPAHPTSHSQA